MFCSQNTSSHGRFDKSRAEAVDANVMRCKFDCHRLGKALHGVFRCTVDGAPGGADVPHLRGDIDDRARKPGLDQSKGDRLRDEKRSTHVECKDRIEILDLDVGEISWPVRARVVDEDLKRRCRDGYGATSRFDVSHVEHQRLGLAAARANGARRLLDLPSGARRERHLRAGLGQRRGRCKPDAAPAAGDKRAPAVEAEGGSFRKIDRSHDLLGRQPFTLGRRARGNRQQRKTHSAARA